MASWLIDTPRQLTLDGLPTGQLQTDQAPDTAAGPHTAATEVNRLDVWLASGRLRVVTSPGPARIDVHRVGRRGVIVTLLDGVLSVRHKIADRRPRWLGPLWWLGVGWRRYTADLTIAVPPTTPSSLTVVSGSIVASGLRRGATIDVTSGSIALNELGGVVRAKTVSGSIEALGGSGDLGLQTISGEISLAGSSAERLFARTVSGSLTCDLDNPQTRDVRLDTISGEITVRVPEDADLEVTLGATSGRVVSAFSQLRGSGLPGHTSATGRLGTGAGTLHAYAVSGSVSLLAHRTDDGGALGTAISRPEPGRAAGQRLVEG